MHLQLSHKSDLSMGVLNLIDLFSLYVLDKLLTLTYSLVTNLDKFSLPLSNKFLILLYSILYYKF